MIAFSRNNATKSGRNGQPLKVLAWKPVDRHHVETWQSLPIADIAWEPKEADAVIFERKATAKG